MECLNGQTDQLFISFFTRTIKICTQTAHITTQGTNNLPCKLSSSGEVGEEENHSGRGRGLGEGRGEKREKGEKNLETIFNPS